MIPGNGIDAEDTKALALALGHLTEMTKLDLSCEYCDVCECRVCECVCMIFIGW